MEELIPFLFFLFWILVPIFSSKGRKEKARQRAEAERLAREARAEQQRAMRESREAGGRTTYSDTQTQSTGSSLDMVPDELWAILTGGAPRPTAPPTETTREPVSAGGWVTSPPWDEEDAVNSVEGVSAETEGEDRLDYDDEADRIARARYEDVRATSWDEQPTSRDAASIALGETSDARHISFHDRMMADEIGAQEVAAAIAARPTARSRVGLSGIADVRRAIVLTEILGPPKALRY